MQGKLKNRPFCCTASIGCDESDSSDAVAATVLPHRVDLVVTGTEFEAGGIISGFLLMENDFMTICQDRLRTSTTE